MPLLALQVQCRVVERRVDLDDERHRLAAEPTMRDGADGRCARAGPEPRTAAELGRRCIGPLNDTTVGEREDDAGR